MSDEVERTLCQINQVFVFKIPARQSAEGHRAADWPKEPSWTGKLKVVARGSVAAIILLDNTNQIFAVCQVVDDSSVEKTLDSGRYFVLKITNQQGRHAYIGIAFNERNDAFDFSVALNEFKQETEREQKASAWSQSIPTQDFSLKSGEKIKIKLTPKKAHTEEESFGVQASAAKQTIHNEPWSADPWGSDPFASAPTASATKSNPSRNLLDL